MLKQESRDRPVKPTPAMICAGMAALYEYETFEVLCASHVERIAIAAYEAMELARCELHDRAPAHNPRARSDHREVVAKSGA
jgi:hypothetical protein